MSELDEKLNSILSNPQMMQQIMSLAQTLGQNTQSGEENAQPKQQQRNASDSGLNPSILSKFSNIMQHGTIDRDQQSLLKALSPYLSRTKLQKLERAMHAAKMARIASEMVNVRSQKTYPGR